ncbi:hypothetical protein GLOIN_2v1771076 [Rhizophagus irregularis DAOM 181602=DAOM 197198]|uniref:Uncharacterized protein n=1 Tax=Rhizophagus irregularis (strain DAOM 181602 / DAOM 197198 / MUCL 43194) TaxID=747089 RepID=A0A2P4QAH2_RHIID|nr:hypothetical protein GLOIN_2v1771076 [Rhizophagus irregularis DAOM 181602=DAOM 197198]POG74644.1 hypothetical protein GLOIN_2v1771076 [Rhizophagus irregularis DAOM 181602=DAOM 197198]GET50547.1 hypothetical protein GLOIN_2v1771076 [Rhizophagus irregularis DAOM 181602=DAOM 197198]|eukprot:XP_025181510.1 hypothetical protein GLOIN_2v1771076 [Rhizophagus irregularis DAOM 181602=DAOM 197198]
MNLNGWNNILNLFTEQAFKFTSLTVIQQFCTNLIAKFTDKIFNSLDFTPIPKKSLVQLIKSDLQMKEIEIFCLSSIEFLQKVRPYQKLFKRQFYEDLLSSYLEPNNVSTENILLPRNIKVNDSKFVNSNIVSIISRWIDKVDINHRVSHLREFYLPYKLELLLRGSRDGFTPKKFHTLLRAALDIIDLRVVGRTSSIL